MARKKVLDLSREFRKDAAAEIQRTELAEKLAVLYGVVEGLVAENQKQAEESYAASHGFSTILKLMNSAEDFLPFHEKSIGKRQRSSLASRLPALPIFQTKECRCWMDCNCQKVRVRLEPSEGRGYGDNIRPMAGT